MSRYLPTYRKNSDWKAECDKIQSKAYLEQAEPYIEAHGPLWYYKAGDAWMTIDQALRGFTPLDQNNSGRVTMTQTKMGRGWPRDAAIYTEMASDLRIFPHPLTVQEYHKKYCELDGDKWMYRGRKPESEVAVDVYDQLGLEFGR